MCSSDLSLAVALVGPLGLKGVAIAYSASWVVNAVAAFIIARRRAGYTLDPRAARAVLAAVAVSILIVPVAALPGGFSLACAALVLLGWWSVAARGETRRAIVLVAARVRG